MDGFQNKEIQMEQLTQESISLKLIHRTELSDSPPEPLNKLM